MAFYRSRLWVYNISMNAQHKAWNERQKRLVEYWGTRTLAGLILMPATRHPLVHLNEAMRIKDLLHRRERKVQ